MLFLAAAISRPKELCVAASWTVFKLRIDRRYRCPLRNGHTVFTGGNNKSRWRHRPPFGASLSDTLDRTGGNLCFFRLFCGDETQQKLPFPFRRQGKRVGWAFIFVLHTKVLFASL